MTGGNAPDGEAPCSTVYPGDDHETPVPMGFTAWYTVKGTGASMTVDTTNSDFDTVAAVYTSGPGGSSRSICIDDVSSRTSSCRPRRPGPAWPGSTYYLQIGGFDRSAGHLEFTVK